LRLVATDRALLSLRFPGDPSPTDAPRASLALREPHPVLDSAEREVVEYFAGARTVFETPLAPEGTPFQRRVWSALLEIPYGQVRSYGHIAQRIGKPSAVRAVGGANGCNPLPIFVPCHRVVGQDGSLTGFSSGVDLKRWLLDHEAAPS
jgi:methylated-DNA-[protein]-cysteine S-methyltransferase